MGKSKKPTKEILKKPSPERSETAAVKEETVLQAAKQGMPPSNESNMENMLAMEV